MLSQAAVSLVWLPAAGKPMEVGAVGGASGDVGGGRGSLKAEALLFSIYTVPLLWTWLWIHRV